MLYSAQTNAFYVPEIHGANVPPDAKPVDATTYARVVSDRPGNMEVYAGADGMPDIRPRTEPVPPYVTMYQARSVLIDDELIDDVETALSAMPEGKEKRKARAAWEYATTVDRDSEFTQMLAAALGLTDSQLDSLFTRANKVK